MSWVNVLCLMVGAVLGILCASMLGAHHVEQSQQKARRLAAELEIVKRQRDDAYWLCERPYAQRELLEAKAWVDGQEV